MSRYVKSFSETIFMTSLTEKNCMGSIYFRYTLIMLNLYFRSLKSNGRIL